MTRLLICDHCGAQGRETKTAQGPRVVSLTMHPWGRRIELCGACRVELNAMLNDWLIGCKHRNPSFDRSLCACGAMHYFCQDCGVQIDACHQDAA